MLSWNFRLYLGVGLSPFMLSERRFKFCLTVNQSYHHLRHQLCYHWFMTCLQATHNDSASSQLDFAQCTKRLPRMKNSMGMVGFG
jgi:hypothetical protein